MLTAATTRSGINAAHASACGPPPECPIDRETIDADRVRNCRDIRGSRCDVATDAEASIRRIRAGRRTASGSPTDRPRRTRAREVRRCWGCRGARRPRAHRHRRFPRRRRGGSGRRPPARRVARPPPQVYPTEIMRGAPTDPCHRERTRRNREDDAGARARAVDRVPGDLSRRDQGRDGAHGRASSTPRRAIPSPNARCQSSSTCCRCSSRTR